MASSSSQPPAAGNRERSNHRSGVAPAVPQVPAAGAFDSLHNVGSNARVLARELLSVTFTPKEQTSLNNEPLPPVRMKMEQLFRERGDYMNWLMAIFRQVEFFMIIHCCIIICGYILSIKKLSTEALVLAA